MTRLHPFSRLLLLLSVLALISAFFTPLWQIQLWAPQYPEGLNMKIWIDNLTGAFEIINGLNHYIGMAMIELEMFPEFLYMKYVLAALIALGLWCVVAGTRRWLWIYVIVLALGALAGLVDFYRWGYEYGHNLDPNAAIQVPGMTYQPPVIGYKNLLNFTAYSGPDIGGWIMIAAGCVAGLVLAWEQWWRGRVKQKGTLAAAIATLVVPMGFTACKAEAEPFRYGRDECAECRMIISDQRFGAQIVTHKGRVLKYDDLNCLLSHEAKDEMAGADIKLRVVANFSKPGGLLPVEGAHYLLHADLKSPMRGNTAAFSSEDDRTRAQSELGGGKPMTWEEARTSLQP
ncbi:MAG: nitrous oxide reductase accessory protein NosL [Verrucomicrobiales bacterium]|nr:nitrous oxide reductase accessory protein NosL [Verrucomicrobiales bacterium]